MCYKTGQFYLLLTGLPVLCYTRSYLPLSWPITPCRRRPALGVRRLWGHFAFLAPDERFYPFGD